MVRSLFFNCFKLLRNNLQQAKNMQSGKRKKINRRFADYLPLVSDKIKVWSLQDKFAIYNYLATL
jgi:hypothetical protein